MTNQHEGVWSIFRDRMEADLGPIKPYESPHTNTVLTWPLTGTLGAFCTMDVGDHTSLNPDPDFRPLYRARVKHAAFKEEVRSLNDAPDGSGIDPEPSTPIELPVIPNLGGHRPGWLASAIRNIGRRRTA